MLVGFSVTFFTKKHRFVCSTKLIVVESLYAITISQRQCIIKILSCLSWNLNITREIGKDYPITIVFSSPHHHHDQRHRHQHHHYVMWYIICRHIRHLSPPRLESEYQHRHRPRHHHRHHHRRRRRLYDHCTIIMFVAWNWYMQVQELISCSWRIFVYANYPMGSMW